MATGFCFETLLARVQEYVLIDIRLFFLREGCHPCVIRTLATKQLLLLRGSISLSEPETVAVTIKKKKRKKERKKEKQSEKELAL